MTRRTRRTSSPVRVSLAATRGGDIDGAWWPYSASIAGELPNLVDALYPAIGEVLDIRINWNQTAPAPVMSTLSAAASLKMGWPGGNQRLMALAGDSARVRLLVVPAMTTAALAVMVLRCAAGRALPDVDGGTPAFDAAERAVQAARAESAGWRTD